MAKTAGKKKEKSKGIQEVGWGFWLICFVVFYGPSWYIAREFSYDDRKVGLFPMIVGFAIAAFGAGLLSFVLNFIIQKRLEFAHKRGRKSK